MCPENVYHSYELGEDAGWFPLFWTFSSEWERFFRVWEISLIESEIEIVLEERVMMTVENMGWDIVLNMLSNVSQIFQWTEDFSMGPEVVR